MYLAGSVELALNTTEYGAYMHGFQQSLARATSARNYYQSLATS